MGRQYQQRIAEPSFIAGLLFFVMIIAGFSWLALHIQQWLNDEQRAPVEKVMIAGQSKYIEQQAIRDLIDDEFGQSFFALDVVQVHSKIEQLPWVYRASLRKEWPSTLKIFLVEQQPVAWWNGDLLINQYGDTFQAKIKPEQLRLPNLFGPGGTEVTALEGYRAMQSLLHLSGLKIEELLLSERFAWNLTLNNGIELRLGRSEFIDRLQRFVDLYPVLQTKPVDYVDLRYDTGLAIGWLNPANKKNKKGDT